MQNNPELRRMEPTISVNQWTPEISLPITINAEKIIVKRLIILLMVLFFNLRFDWKIRVGITLNTSNVVEEG